MSGSRMHADRAPCAMRDARDCTVFESILVRASADCPRAGEGSAELLKDGSIVFAYGAFNGPEDHADAAIVKRVSRDCGATWSEPEILQEKSGGLNVMSASLLRLKNGELAFLYLAKHSVYTDCRPMIRLSRDDGRSWSDPREITDVPGYYVVNNDRLLQTAHGRILVPCAWYHTAGGVRGQSACGVIYSDDSGANWRRGRGWIKIRPENVAVPPLADGNSKKAWEATQATGIVSQEPGVVELADGSLMMWIRTNVGFMYAAFSGDAGDTWSDFRPVTDIVSPCAPQSIKRLPGSNRLICIYNDHSSPDFVFGDEPNNGLYWHWRTPLTAAASDNDGKTWKRIGNIEGLERNYCYTSILFFGDKVLLSYYLSEETGKKEWRARRNLASLKVKVIGQDYFRCHSVV